MATDLTLMNKFTSETYIVKLLSRVYLKGSLYFNKHASDGVKHTLNDL